MPAIKYGYEFDINLVTSASHKKIMNSVLRREMEKHRDLTLIKHFQRGAASRWNYEPVSKKWAVHKAAKLGEIIPMVYTGRMRDIVLTSSKVTATATQSRLYVKNYFAMREEFRSQVERINPDEQIDKAKSIGREYTRLANTPTYQRRRRVRSK